MLRSRAQTREPLNPAIQSWLDGSQETTEGLHNPHAVIIPGHGIRYASTPDLDPADIAEINQRRAEIFGLGPLSLGTEVDRSFVLRSPSNREVIGVMASFALEGARNLFRR